MTIATKIKDLRIRNAYSLQTLADLVGVSKAAIQQYEDGSISPSNVVLRNIAETFKVGIWYFYSTPVTSLKLLEFRDGHTLNDKEVEKQIITNQIITKIQNQIELEHILNEEIEFENPIDDIEIFSIEDIEKAVKKLRKKWKLGDAPIDNITKLLEDKGYKIVEVERETDSLGLSGFIENNGKAIPLIIINRRSKHIKEITRLRFTLLHELAHILLKFNKDLSINNQETFCNRFSSAMLLPGDVLASNLGKNRTSVTLFELKELKENFGISIRAIIIRSYESGLISSFTKTKWLEEYESWWENNERGFGEFKKSNERPFRFERLMAKALAEKRIDDFRAVEISGVKADKLKSYFFNDKIFE